MQIVGINKVCSRRGCRWPAGPDTAVEAEVSPFTNHQPALSGAEGSLITNFHSQITAFLIDTLPIRIVFNSLRIIARAISNRHSPETPFRPNLTGVNL